MRAPHVGLNEQGSAEVRGPTVTQAHVKLPTLGKHQGLSVGGGVRKPFHEVTNFTLAGSGLGGLGWFWFSPMTSAGEHAR